MSVTLRAWDGGAWNPPLARFGGTGGFVTETGGYRIHAFLSSGFFAANMPGLVDLLVVAGGGGGSAGGGGAGGLVWLTDVEVDEGIYTIVVGVGGLGGRTTTSPAYTNGSRGGDSSAFGVIALGGGGGAGPDTHPVDGGGSGGGGGSASTGDYLGGLGTPGQGHKGGDKIGFTSSPYVSAGGGGAGGPGLPPSSPTVSGAGGMGLEVDITGTPTWYAGGGGGCTYISSPSHTPGLGGLGGGGAGDETQARPGAPGTGGGGGGTSNAVGVGGAGGSGITVVRYLI